MTDLITKQDYMNEIEKWDCPVKKPTMKTSKAEIIAFYEQYKPRDDNVKVVDGRDLVPFQTLGGMVGGGTPSNATDEGCISEKENQESGGMVEVVENNTSTQQKKKPTCASDVINLILEKHRKNK